MTVIRQFNDATDQWDIILAGEKGETGAGVPAGGSVASILAKAGTADYDTEWTSTPTLDAIYFDTSAGLEVAAEGDLVWDTDAGTIDLGLEGGLVHKVGEDLFYRVQAAENITKGQLVMAVGTIGNSGVIEVAKSATTYGGNPMGSERLMGLALGNINSGERGYVLAAGQLRKVNTNAYEEGQILWADPTVAGGLTATRPSAPNWKTVVAFVVTKSATVGTLQVRVTPGSSLGNDELVELAGLQDGDTLLWDAAQGRFENGQPPTALVDSVNGQTGTVVLDATDVGAYPDDNPSSFITSAGAPVQSVNGATGTVVLNAANVGALGTAGGTATGKIVAPDFDYGVTTAGSDTVALDFSTGDGYLSRLVGGTAVSITGTGYTPGVTRTVRLVGGTAVASLSVPVDWKFVGTAAGTSLGTAVTAIVTATSFGTAASDVVAAYAEQP